MSGDTRDTILTTARIAVQKCGFAELSFRDLASSVGIKSSSIHYHFPTKADLGMALIRSYTEAARQDLEGIAARHERLSDRLRRYFGLFRGALANGNRMCLYGILAAEAEALPPEVRNELQAFEQVNVEWLTRVLEAGVPEHSALGHGGRARAIFAAAIGAQIVARGRADVDAYDAIVDTLFDTGLIPPAT